ncbi:hypothetical protein BC628DRAFT_532635 [Trametes gibbosa]|nr:hypothetical protein BC628DRAFT_532635 [Trametes gibbosa]
MGNPVDRRDDRRPPRIGHDVHVGLPPPLPPLPPTSPPSPAPRALNRHAILDSITIRARFGLIAFPLPRPPSSEQAAIPAANGYIARRTPRTPDPRSPCSCSWAEPALVGGARRVLLCAYPAHQLPGQRASAEGVHTRARARGLRHAFRSMRRLGQRAYWTCKHPPGRVLSLLGIGARDGLVCRRLGVAEGARVCVCCVLFACAVRVVARTSVSLRTRWRDRQVSASERRRRLSFPPTLTLTRACVRVGGWRGAAGEPGGTR